LSERDVAYDYILFEFDRDIGDKTGWLGYQTFDNSWMHGAYIDIIGSPSYAQLGGNQQTVFYNDAAMRDIQASFSSEQALYLEHDLDVSGGQSGAPMYG